MKICDPANMKADSIEISRDTEKNKWLVRIRVGEEVIRRYCDQPKEANEQELRAAAEKTALDEGYSVEGANITVRS